MEELNSTIIRGRLCADPQIKEVNGKPLCEMNVANNGYKKDDVYYFQVTAWGKVAENCGKYLKKGSPVIISGKLIQNRWTSKEGKNASKITINATTVEFLPSPKKQENYSEQSGAAWE